MEITGKLIQLLPEVQGESARGPWVRGGFVIETGEDYPRKVAFVSFGEERVAMAKSIPMGTLVQVTFNPESREFNERWYTDLRASRIQPFVPGQMPPATGGYNYIVEGGGIVQHLCFKLAERCLAKLREETRHRIVIAFLESTVEVKKLHTTLGSQTASEGGLAAVHIPYKIVLHAISSFAVCNAAAVGGSLLSITATSVIRSSADNSLIHDTVRSPSVSL